MRVLLVNGSPHEHGCTDAAVREVERTLHEEGVESGYLWLGKGEIPGCRACLACRKLGRCVYDDKVNEAAEMMKSCDGFIIGAPVHYSSAGAAACAFMDRLFYSSGDQMRGKPAAALVSARRAGTTAALERLNQYFLITGMPVVPSQYWNMVHGSSPEEVMQDLEGLQIMRTLGRNMAWLIKCIEAGKNAGIAMPAQETPRERTNFIR